MKLILAVLASLRSRRVWSWSFHAPLGSWRVIATLIVATAASLFAGAAAHALFIGCGDGIVMPELGEECDFGYPQYGTCCSPSCQIEAAGTPCSHASLCSSNGVCDGVGSSSGSCVATDPPHTGCRGALQSTLLLKNSSNDDSDKLVWKWIKGDQTSVEDFGMPMSTTSYALCVYAGTTNALIDEIQVSADSINWSPISTVGYKHWGTGIRKMILRAGDQGKAKVLMSGKGAALADPTLDPPLPLPVTAQLINSTNNICFEGVYDTGDSIKNDTLRFKAVAR